MKQFSFFKTFFILVLFSLSFNSRSQVAINTTGVAPNSSAMLDVVSVTKGLLIPRMTQAQRNAIATPATGLLVYQTDNTPGFYYYNGSSWTTIGDSSSSTQKFVDLTTEQTIGGAKTWSNLGTFNAGLTSTGSTINLNSSSNFITNINNGTSTGAVNIANGTIGGNLISIGNTIGATGITQRVGSGNFSLDGAASSSYSIGTSTTTGTITIGGTGLHTGTIGIGTGIGAQTLNFGTGGTGKKTINIGTGPVANSILIGNTTAGTTTGVNVASSTAQFHLGAGRASAKGAPLKFTAGTNLTTPESGSVEFDGTNYYATSGTTRYTLAKTLTATATLNFGSTFTNRSSDLTIAVTGAAVGDVVILGVPSSAVVTNSCYTCWVSSRNTVTVRFNNYSATSINPSSGTFRVTVLKY